MQKNGVLSNCVTSVLSTLHAVVLVALRNREVRVYKDRFLVNCFSMEVSVAWFVELRIFLRKLALNNPFCAYKATTQLIFMCIAKHVLDCLGSLLFCTHFLFCVHSTTRI